MSENLESTVNNNLPVQVDSKPYNKAQTVTIINISTDCLVDNPNNGEDTTYTADLELSIRENGFIDPIDITDYGMEEGKYMIVSGHRRRLAGENVGMQVFPCILRHFDSKEEMVNHMLLSQSFRDSSKDPLLYAKRYKLHEQYLKDIGFKGKFRVEIAKRLGLSVQQADRYANFGKLIQSVWDAVESDYLTITAVQPMASHDKEEQAGMMDIINEALQEQEYETLTCGQVKDIVDAYIHHGARNYRDVLNCKQQINSAEEPDEDVPNVSERNKEYLSQDVSQAETEEMNYMGIEDQKHLFKETHDDLEDANDQEKKAEKEEALKQGHTDEVFRALSTIEKELQEEYMCKSSAEAEMLVRAYLRTVNDLITEMSNLIVLEDMPGKWPDIAADIRKTLDSCDELQK